jgi:choline kinase
MLVTKAIILAAGVGSRLRPLTDDRPKCLLDVGGRTILDHQLTSLRRWGVDDIVMVLGYRGDHIRTHLGAAARYVDNPRYENTNSLYSLWLAREELASGALILNSDVLAPAALFERLLRSPAPDAVLVERGSHFEAEDMKVTLRGWQVVDFSKGLTVEQAHAHNVGVAKFSGPGGPRLVGCLDELVAAGHEDDWVPVAFREYASRWPLAAVATDGLPWIEIDYPADLERARTEVEPAILTRDAAVSAG